MSNTNSNAENIKLKPAPFGLTLASLLIWGWQTELLLYAIVMGILFRTALLYKMAY